MRECFINYAIVLPLPYLLAAVTHSLSRFAASLFGSVSLETKAKFDLTTNGAGLSEGFGSGIDLLS